MGVKDLWMYLSPVSEKKSLWELQGLTVAIDLSCWICDSQSQCFPVLRPYMRNLFFRTSCLLMLGIRPVFVLEGEVPDIKQREIKRRINALCEGDDNNRKMKRSRLNGIIAQCKKLLEALGVYSLKSPGEAEAMCARLNDALVVDGCISQDSDCFLYGARVVYRNFSAACSSKGGASFAVDSYDMVRIQELLGLNREGLVALALLCGCDYQENSDGLRGVAGIGIETASYLIRGLSRMCCSVLSRLQLWRSDPYYDKLEEEAVAVNKGPTCSHCGHRGNLGRHDRVGCKNCNYKEGCKVISCLSSENSLLNMPIEDRKLLMLELKVRAKAVAYTSFPSQLIIDEFLAPVPDAIQLKKSDVSWNSPCLSSFLEIAENYLGWSKEYSLDKFLPLLTRWKVMQGGSAARVLHPNDVTPVSIKKKRVSKGVHCFEVEWNLIPSVLEMHVFSTLEPISLFEKAYPLLSQEFLNKKGKGKSKPKRGADMKAKVRNKNSKVCCCLGSVKKGHICKFLNRKCDMKEEVGDPIGDNLSNAVKGVTKSLETVSIGDLDSSSAEEYLSNLDDDDFDQLELSAIINCIIEGNDGTKNKRELDETLEHHSNKSSSNRSKLSTLDISEESLKRFSGDELEKIATPMYSSGKYSLKDEEVDIECYGEEITTLCKQMETVNLEKVIRKNEDDEDNSYILHSDTAHLKGHFLEPNFDLGVSVLLRSPVTANVSKSVDDT